MSAPIQYSVGIDFGNHYTRAVVLAEQNNNVKLFDSFEIRIDETFKSMEDRYVAGLLDVSNYLKNKKIALKSAVTNLNTKRVRVVPYIAEVKNYMPFQMVPNFLLSYVHTRALSPKIRPNERVIQQYIGALSIDDRVVSDGHKLRGKKLRQDSISVVTDISDYIELMNASNETGIYIEDVYPSNLAVMYLSERIPLAPNEYTLHIDLGSHTTKTCFFNHQRVLAAENFEFGSENITSIIAEELNLEWQEAEQLKCSPEFMRSWAVAPASSAENRLNRRLRHEIAVLLQMIINYSKNYGLSSHSLRNIVLSGAGAKLCDLKISIIDFFHVPCEIVGEGLFKYFLNYKIRPEFNCSMGLAYTSYLIRKGKNKPKTAIAAIGNYFQEKVDRLLFTD